MGSERPWRSITGPRSLPPIRASRNMLQWEWTWPGKPGSSPWPTAHYPAGARHTSPFIWPDHRSRTGVRRSPPESGGLTRIWGGQPAVIGESRSRRTMWVWLRMSPLQGGASTNVHVEGYAELCRLDWRHTACSCLMESFVERFVRHEASAMN
ncbi:hypothetical protein BN1708_000252 [Verticillium longisporum]|uniref:Uncharacterized protein n=1 Tax=Verticillium longisporum TaxID=100787 RepID=A0A0G4KCH6_VERLO|nr:hypothetical protein BN1708_000252 [Verticillium longisporum]